MEMTTSTPMEISVQIVTNGDAPHEQTDAVPDSAVDSSPPPAVAEDKILISGIMNSKKAYVTPIRLVYDR